MWEARANPRGPGGGRLISPSALPLPGILFCLFLCLSLGPDPVNEINEVRAEIFSVQDTSGLWPFPWLQRVAESLCLSFPACLVWMAHTNTWWAFAGSTGDEIGIAFLFLEASETVPVLYWPLPLYSHVFPTKLMPPVCCSATRPQ